MAFENAATTIPSITKITTTTRITITRIMSQCIIFVLCLSNRNTKSLSKGTIDNSKESGSLLHKSGLIFQLRTEHYKLLETRTRQMSLRLDSQCKSIHDRVAREKEEESATPFPAPT